MKRRKAIAISRVLISHTYTSNSCNSDYAVRAPLVIFHYERVWYETKDRRPRRCYLIFESELRKRKRELSSPWRWRASMLRALEKEVWRFSFHDNRNSLSPRQNGRGNEVIAMITFTLLADATSVTERRNFHWKVFYCNLSFENSEVRVVSQNNMVKWDNLLLYRWRLCFCAIYCRSNSFYVI